MERMVRTKCTAWPMYVFKARLYLFSYSVQIIRMVPMLLILVLSDITDKPDKMFKVNDLLLSYMVFPRRWSLAPPLLNKAV